MPRTGTPSLAHGCQLTACLSLQRARVEHRGFPNVFRALESFRLAMILRADRREEWSATLMGTRKLAPAEAGRWRGEARNLAATRLARANRRKASGSPFWFRRPRGFATAGGCRLRLPISRPGLQLGRVGCSPGITERTLALLRRAKYPHCSAHSRERTRQFASAPFTQLPLHRFRSSTAHSACANLTRPLYKLRLSPKPDLVATANAYSARLTKTPNAGRAFVPVGSGASPEGPQRCALREARTFTSFRFSHSRFALRPERRDPPGIAGNERNSPRASHGQGTRNIVGTDQLSIASQATLLKLARPPVKLQIGPRPQRWTPRPAVSGSPCFPGTGRHSATFHRRGLGESCTALPRQCPETK